MTLKYKIINDGNFLKVIASGFCDNLEKYEEYVTCIDETLKRTGHKKILIDESRLVYRFSTVDIYKSGCFVSNLGNRPHKIAILCHAHGWRDAKFWETVAQNRFVSVRIFKDRKNAKKWVLN
jgi:hypothetical protein